MTKRLDVYLPDDEHAALVDMAHATGLSRSRVLRDAFAGVQLKPIPQIPELNRAAYLELARIGNNLNQLAANSNAGTVVNVDSAVLKKLAELVTSLRAELIK